MIATNPIGNNDYNGNFQRLSTKKQISHTMFQMGIFSKIDPNRQQKIGDPDHQNRIIRNSPQEVTLQHRSDGSLCTTPRTFGSGEPQPPTPRPILRRHKNVKERCANQHQKYHDCNKQARIPTSIPQLHTQQNRLTQNSLINKVFVQLGGNLHLIEKQSENSRARTRH